MKKDKDSSKDCFFNRKLSTTSSWMSSVRKGHFSIKPRSTYTFINVDLDKTLEFPTNHIQSTQVEGENVQFFKDLNTTMDNFVFHSNFHTIDMDDMYITFH
jgi:hypothetical protein